MLLTLAAAKLLHSAAVTSSTNGDNSVRAAAPPIAVRASTRNQRSGQLRKKSRQGVATLAATSRRASSRSKPGTALRKPLGVRPEGVRNRNLYGYVQNDPINLIDPSGLEVYVHPKSPGPAIVKPEDGPWGTVPPGHRWPGSPDGVIGPDGQLAVPGRGWLPDSDITVGPDGVPKCTGGACRWLPEKEWPNEKEHPDWIPPKNPPHMPQCTF